MREFEEKFIQMINTYNELENLNLEFVPGVKVSHSDAHLLDLMAKNPHKKVSELAEAFGVTKGAVSQQIKKLEKRDLIERIRMNDNYREVYIELTDKGKIAVKNHNKFHDILFKDFAGILNNLNPEQTQFINTILETVTNLLRESETVLKKEL